MAGPWSFVSKAVYFFFFVLANVTVEANMIIQNEIHVLQVDLAVFSPNIVMFIKTELALKQNSHSKISCKYNPALHF